jgi:hypothetical protein
MNVVTMAGELASSFELRVIRERQNRYARILFLEATASHDASRDL